MEKVIKSIPELERFAREFLGQLSPDTEGATVVGLSGDLGSGKTAFTKAVAKILGVKESVLSPTFVLAKFYELSGHPAWSRLVHIDAYRIDEPEELPALRWEEIAVDPRNLVLIEWPERIDAGVPKNIATLRFRFVDETTRAIV
ncbi:MAG: tRNA (adenosine(37)-N6)-threonylcarbamoyltransferase complex ATPase subunit type 1 TsaE [Candidatus Lloydbacteria bacterium RIFCSPHIGHO2_01_FULL_54_11]|uniref:tRNA threonylcarbamoyladenosine biosynthesis protein TsaE n=1 Tax=Candidatus Lloydbacteria bacterium RIFCSPHIGHO2_02_FULL_50_13 TaxID=1798661 RepID=A0A1G2D3J3_9BACT|nr:MAG: tRNA (adenosine(37)-N6)-threonylcarbamoyltransferase complex ATPase subunit type 1 TsaE [Candidatus Lloydbacteria bacterium RIFCSPHIGHO2_01_FULL_54_11]OGZ07318.1 MAG: tRNA (adenosine(37)-N6)-threonylcarbamoyltransferase complex ATPase subunit type 1 TsaE [Candidatus Lloydbacteria bacterium RIFCSPHIGHO2_02_FULL_50_13]OGZ14951.1 MAG: tRNA (adenosine(37)-N6)-threonylcarbamoyltransferase complex ATPase subunit type 1 TsaE [Candidatus Lloydbacteria bacterium RIFCSPLOWO2_02_FULL_54_12]